MMLWLHLFSNVDHTLSLTNLIVLNNIPLASLIARACPPVGFFVFCGGYGLYYTYRRGKDKHYLSRISKLFIAYWLITLVLIPLCICFTDYSFALDWQSIILNITALKTSWNYPCWFLFPYALLSLSYPILFSLFDKIRVRYVLTATFILNFSIIVLLHLYGATYINDRPYLSIPVSYLGFLFLFFCGAAFLRCDIVSTFRKQIKFISGGVICVGQIISLIILIILKIISNSAADGGLYTIGIILLLLASPINPKNYLVIVLEKIGSHSMNMWMIHYLLYTYLFHEIIWGFQYPIIIFVVLLLLSYMSSILFNIIIKQIYKKLHLA